MRGWDTEAWDLRPANVDSPSELLECGTAQGQSLLLDLDSFEDFGSSNIASIQKGRAQNGNKVVIKCARASHKQPPHDVRNEARILASLSHPNVCELLNAYHVQDWYILVEPYSPFTLRAVLDNPSFSPEHDAGAFMRVARGLILQMCHAMAYLEEQRVAHRDVCPSNWVLDHDGHVKLIDFSVAISLPDQTSSPDRLEFQLGTGPYRPPELLFGCTAYDPFAVDRWMLGSTIAEFFTAMAQTKSKSESDYSEDSFDAEPVPLSRRKTSFFDGGMSDFTLIGSIFKTLGTPTAESWPDTPLLPDFGKFSFRTFEAANLADRLPLLPESERDSGVSFVSAFLRYTFEERQSASEACEHAFLGSSSEHKVRLAHEQGLGTAFQEGCSRLLGLYQCDIV